MKIKFTLILCFFIVNITIAQEDVDSLFMSARKLAFNSEYQAARSICDRILRLSPTYVDANVLTGRTYSWNSQYDSAKFAFQKALDRKPAYYDAISAMIDTYNWNDEYKGALNFCTYGLQKHPNDRYFEIKKINAYTNLKAFPSALSMLDSLLYKYPNNDTLQALMRTVRLAKVANKISVSYTLDLFEDNTPEPWHLVYLQYSRKTPYGGVIARLNQANRFGNKGTQFEIDAYPGLGKKMYGYFNIGFSQASIFPKARLGGELYRSLPKSFEVSLGFRHLIFNSSNVTIYTAYIGKYIGNEWLSFRTFITPSDDGNASVSGGLVMRHYFADSGNYLGFGMGFGSSPDDRAKYYDSKDNLREQSYTFKTNFARKISDFWAMNAGVAYEHSNFNTTRSRKNYTFDLSFSYSF